MDYKFKARPSGGGVPVGIYKAIFEGFEEVPANLEKDYKAAFKFKFRIIEGEHKGAIATRVPGGSWPTEKNGLGKFLSEMTATPNTSEADYDVEPLLGKNFTIVVKQSDGGGTRVDTVIMLK